MLTVFILKSHWPHILRSKALYFSETKRRSRKLGHRVSIMMAGTAGASRFSGSESLGLTTSAFWSRSADRWECALPVFGGMFDFASLSEAAVSHRALSWGGFPEQRRLVGWTSPVPPPAPPHLPAAPSENGALLAPWWPDET